MNTAWDYTTVHHSGQYCRTLWLAAPQFFIWSLRIIHETIKWPIQQRNEAIPQLEQQNNTARVSSQQTCPVLYSLVSGSAVLYLVIENNTQSRGADLWCTYCLSMQREKGLSEHCWAISLIPRPPLLLPHSLGMRHFCIKIFNQYFYTFTTSS